MTDLQIREALQRSISRLVKRGASDDDVAEQAFTVALANLVAVKGAHRAAYAAISSGGALKMLGEQADQEKAAPKH